MRLPGANHGYDADSDRRDKSGGTCGSPGERHTAGRDSAATAPFAICIIRRVYRLSSAKRPSPATRAVNPTMPADPKITRRASSVTIKWQQERSLWLGANGSSFSTIRDPSVDKNEDRG